MSKKSTKSEVVKIEDYDDDRPDMFRVTMPTGIIYDVHAKDEKAALKTVEDSIEEERKLNTANESE